MYVISKNSLASIVDFHPAATRCKLEKKKKKKNAGEGIRRDIVGSISSRKTRLRVCNEICQGDIFSNNGGKDSFRLNDRIRCDRGD